MLSDRQTSRAEFLFLFLFLSIVIGQNAWVPGFFMDGMIYAALGKNAALHGHWLVPKLHDQLLPEFFEHPPFFFMWEGVLFKLFGVSWTLARLSGAIFTFGAVFALWRMLKKVGHERLAFASAFILAATYPYIKKSRFPNLDLPLTFFCCAALCNYYLAYSNPSKKAYWYLCGLCFGGALLSKGLPAGIVPAIIFFHLLFTKKLQRLVSPHPWMALLLGFALFGLWPLSLYLNGSEHGFITWWHNQFTVTVLEGRQKSEHLPFFYFWYLGKYSPPWSYLALITLCLLIKKKLQKQSLNSLEIFALCWCFVTLIPLSFMRWKLSHYMMPAYPGQALMAGLLITKLKEDWQAHIWKALNLLIFVAAILFIVFPIGSKPRRQKELIQVLDLLKTTPQKPSTFINIDGAYPEWAFVATLSFASDIPVKLMTAKQWQQSTQTPRAWLFVDPNKSEFTQTQSLIRFSHRRLEVLYSE